MLFRSRLFDRPQVLTAGMNAEYGKTGFRNLGQNGFLDSTAGVIGADAYVQQAGIESTNRRLGLFATDTLNASERLAITLSGRYDRATVGLTGTSCSDANALCNNGATLATTPGTNTLTDVSGSHSYSRFNPSLGAAFQFAPQLNG